MAEKFEVHHGPHHEHMHHAAEHAPASMAGQLAVVTAILATVGAMFSYMEGASMADAGLLKNDAAIKKTEAANQWAYYQSKGQKKNLAELGAQLVDDARRPAFEAEAKRYAADQVKIKEAAESLEAQSKAFDDKSGARIHEHHRWAQATTVLQVAIALAAIALLTRRRWLEKAVFVLSAVGFAVGAAAWFHV